jgi:hypothetical protein
METDRRFDCVFSNKVLHHLLREDLVRSIPRQAAVLNDGGMLAHGLWYGDKIEEHGGLHFQYYEEPHIEEIFGELFDIVLMERYEEMEPGDSIFVVARKR